MERFALESGVLMNGAGGWGCPLGVGVGWVLKLLATGLVDEVFRGSRDGGG